MRKIERKGLTTLVEVTILKGLNNNYVLYFADQGYNIQSFFRGTGKGLRGRVKYQTYHRLGHAADNYYYLMGNLVGNGVIQYTRVRNVSMFLVFQWLMCHIFLMFMAFLFLAI